MPVVGYESPRPERLTFRVESIGPGLLDPNQVMVVFRSDEVPAAAGAFTMRQQSVAPYVEALWEAQRSQALYWVNLAEGSGYEFGKVSVPQHERFLLAVQNRQLVEDDE